MCAICNFKIDFGVGHPASLSVAVATRGAMERGELAPQDMTGPLATARLKLASIDTLAAFQAIVEASLPVDAWMTMPDFYILLIEADTWGFFHPTANGFDPDVVPDPPVLTATDPQARSVVVVTSEVTLRAMVESAIDADAAFEKGLVAYDGPEAHRGTVRSLMNGVSVHVSAHVST
ncbi:hypothetical protein [Pararobbsia silviterrae]|uniref:Uncharacterized protein n=1 Tax=Pararobbsia silviterrae TaxID=1792498 RepID=A0A494XAJ5_9BURK|nr:hypothetical protein [Pararobbsia silviterrae]RKP47112.1 hypothetical protein D7S86_23480 [Pararobbsia silviterrae]